ncbi:MAG TPA: DUF512 domain-containing protein [Nitrospiria bacterium]|nr:DUF512 domain-containing protein [Nitrospiria bacterium]
MKIEKTEDIRKGLPVVGVEAGSLGEEAGIEPGDSIISVNGHPLRDVIDYKYFITEERLLVHLVKTNGEEWELEIEKDYDEELGLEFPPLRIRQCPNECEFCFVDQMPGGYRKSLYIRDEDYRFSFLYGNYITLTNLSGRDKARIFDQQLSPLYISVHVTDPEVRKLALQNEKASPVLDSIREMVDHGIRLHTQVVLVPGMNDGEVLEKTIDDLVAFYPKVMSLAIVPVGLTRHRENLPVLQPVDRDHAGRIIDLLQRKQEGFKKTLDYPFVFPADEMFIIGGRPLPPIEYYYDFPQLENGVGMVPAFLSDLELYSRSLPDKVKTPMTVSLVTGVSFYPFLRDALETIRVNGLKFQIFPVINDFLGHSVTMTGLLSGADILSQLKGKDLGDLLLVPSVALNDDQLFLDDTPFIALEESLKVPVRMVHSTARGFLQYIESLAS